MGWGYRATVLQETINAIYRELEDHQRRIINLEQELTDTKRRMRWLEGFHPAPWET